VSKRILKLYIGHSTQISPRVSIFLRWRAIHSFIFFDDWQDSAATINRTLFSFTNLGCVNALQSEGQSNRSKSSGAKMSAIPMSISSTCGEEIWDITRGMHAKVAIPAKMKLSVRRSVQWDIVGKRSSFESGAVGRNAYETLKWRKFDPTAGKRRVMAGHSMCCWKTTRKSTWVQKPSETSQSITTGMWTDE